MYAQALHEGTALKRRDQYATKLSLGRLKWKPLPQSFGGQPSPSWKNWKAAGGSPPNGVMPHLALKKETDFFFPSKKEEKAVRQKHFPKVMASMTQYVHLEYTSMVE